jgi:hypothetical protein
MNLLANASALIIDLRQNGGGFPIDEHFGVGIPTGRAVSPIMGTNWEGTGVTPESRCHRKMPSR